jgi:histidinol dehydrogenase
MLSYDIESMTADVVRRIIDRGGAMLDPSIARARPIVDAVRKDGDTAVTRYAREFDGHMGASFLVPVDTIRTASSRIPPALMSAMTESRRRIESYHAKQKLKGFEFKDTCGVFGQKVVPLGRIGVYAPGGTASYASSVLMAAVPARVAGVDEIALFTPSKNGVVDDAILAAADMVGIEEVYAIGGAQAIAAMAYGTETVRRVDKIVGPGGAIVTAAKLLVRKDCEIDFLAGPSEVLIISDSSSDPALIAAEMLAQLEHDPSAVALTVSTSTKVIEESMALLGEMVRTAKRRAVVKASAEKGAIFLKVRSLKQAMQISNDFAPEHLLIDTRDPEALLDEVTAAGSVFLGSWSSVAFGDYCAGTNHVLPTMGMARSRSALSVYDFVRTIPYQRLTRKGAKRLAPVVAEMAKAEGLPAHASAANARTDGDDK